MGRITLLFTAALLCSAAALAAADTYTYTYKGPAFTYGTDHVEVSFTTSVPLTPSKSYLAKVNASVISGSVTAVGPNGIVNGMSLPLSTFQVHTDATASATTHGIDSWYMLGDISNLAGTAPTMTGVHYQAYTMNSMAFIPGSDIPGSVGLITGHYNYDQGTITSFYSSCTGIPGCQLAGNGQPYVGNYSGIINPANSGASNWKLTVSTSSLILTGSLPNGTVNAAYSSTGLTVSGGVAPYSWSATGLPTGLAIDAASGAVSGTPSTTGTFYPIVTVSDNSGSTALSLVVVIKAALVLAGSLPNGTVGTYYSSSGVTASGGFTPYSFSATGLPAGLTMSTSGAVTGTPTAAGTSSVTVTVKDSAGATASKLYSVTISLAPLVISGTLPSGTQNTAYSSSALTASGGLAPCTWSATGLPAGLSIAASTGVVSGTPTTVGVFSVVVTVTDSTTPTAGTVSKTFSVPIAAAVALVVSGSLPSGTVGVAYSSSGVTATGGLAPFSWSATGLPTGLSIAAATGLVSGTPTTAATYSVAITVRDSAATTKSLTVSVAIRAQLSISGTLKNGTISTFYNSSGNGLTAAGGATPYTWTATGLPSGLSIASATGIVSGTPTKASTVTVTVTVTDSAGTKQTKTQSMTIMAAISIGGTLPSGTAGVAYSSSALTATGGVTPRTWSAAGLPAGLTIASSTGVVSGIPTTAGTSSVTVTVKDSAGSTKTKTQSLVIGAAAALAVSGTLPGGTAGVAYSSSALTATGGVPPRTWSASGLPAGLAIVASSGIVSGTPTMAGTSTVTITVTDSAGTPSTKTMSQSLVIGAAAPLSIIGTLPSGTQDVDYSGALAASGGVPPYTWSATGLPADLFIDASTGVISGIPTDSGTSSVTISVTDFVGTTKSVAQSLLIDAGSGSVTYSCTKPAGATDASGKSTITAIGSGYIVVNGVTVQVPSCAVVEWNNYQTTFAVGQVAEYSGYMISGVTVGTIITID